MTNDEFRSPVFLVTGGTGYIGGELIRYLSHNGVRVRALARSLDKAERVRQLGASEVAIGDVTKPASLIAAVEGVSGVYHIAALYREAGLADHVFFDVNATGTKNIFEAAINAGVPRVVHCSTGGVLGHIANPPAKESDPYNPGDSYQRSKVEGEKLALEYFAKGLIRGAIIRPAMVFGPGDTRHLKMFKMIKRRTFFYVGRGTSWVNFIDIRDLVAAFKLAMDNNSINGGVYHIAGKRAVYLKDAVRMIARELKVSEPRLSLPVKPMQIAGSICESICKPFGINPPLYRRRVDFFTKSRNFDITRARSELGFEPAQELDQEIKDTVNWYAQNGWL